MHARTSSHSLTHERCVTHTCTHTDTCRPFPPPWYCISFPFDVEFVFGCRGSVAAEESDVVRGGRAVRRRKGRRYCFSTVCLFLKMAPERFHAVGFRKGKTPLSFSLILSVSSFFSFTHMHTRSPHSIRWVRPSSVCVCACVCERDRSTYMGLFLVHLSKRTFIIEPTGVRPAAFPPRLYYALLVLALTLNTWPDTHSRSHTHTHTHRHTLLHRKNHAHTHLHTTSFPVCETQAWKKINEFREMTRVRDNSQSCPESQDEVPTVCL